MVVVNFGFVFLYSRATCSPVSSIVVFRSFKIVGEEITESLTVFLTMTTDTPYISLLWYIKLNFNPVIIRLRASYYKTKSPLECLRETLNCLATCMSFHHQTWNKEQVTVHSISFILSSVNATPSDVGCEIQLLPMWKTLSKFPP